MVKDGNERKRYAPATLLVLLLCAGLLERLFPASREAAAPYYVHLMLRQLIWLVPALFMLPWRHMRLGPKKDVKPLLLLAVPLGITAQLFSAGVMAGRPPAAAGSGILLPVTAAEWALTIPALVILPAICEEAFFRGCLTAHLTDAMKPVWACIMSTLLFALIHGFDAGLTGHLLVSLLCTLLMMHTGRVWGSVLLHLAFNACGLLLAYLPGSIWLVCFGLLPFAAVGWMLCRTNKPEQKEQKPTGSDEWVLLIILLLVTIAGNLF